MNSIGVRVSGLRRHRKKDGTIILVEGAHSKIEVEGRKAYLLVLSDVTERNLHEEALRQSMKMEAVGRLAGGVAHDFNNMLTIILGYSNLTLSELDPASTQRPYVEGIRKAAERAAALTRQMLAFSRRQVLQPRILDINGIVAETSSMLRRMIGEHIELQTSVDPTLRNVKADPSQIEQILTSLMIHARDAMPNGGKIVVETRNVTLSASASRQDLGAAPEEYAEIIISDTGSGMDEHSRQRIFEPFFTAKPGAADTGLGLATVYGIVKQSGGHIFVDSELGRGTIFTIYLPAASGEEGIAEMTNKELHSCTGNETILLVEDEAELRYLARDILKRSGYSVIEAMNGEDALEKVAHHAGPISLMISDVVMPKMGGRELARRLRAVRPQTRVIFMSGYANEAVAQDGVLEPGTVYMEKPFSAQALVETVRRTLDDDNA